MKILDLLACGRSAAIVRMRTDGSSYSDIASELGNGLKKMTSITGGLVT